MATSSQLQTLCIVRLSALGDVVLVLPLIRALQAHSPSTRITWVIGKGAYPLVAGLADEGIEFVVIDKPRRIADYLDLRRRLKGRTFDALLCLQASWRANWLYPCISARRKIGYSADRARDFQRFFVKEHISGHRPHLVDGFLQFAEHLGLPKPLRAEWRLPVDKAAAEWAAASLPKEGFVAVSPCASKAERDWPVERHCEVIRSILERKQGPVVLLGGNSEREKQVAATIEKEVSSQTGLINLVGATSLPRLVAALSHAKALIAPDTGAVHMANALGRPVVGLYAVAPAHRTGPYSRSEYCVDVFDRGVRELLGKDPARIPWSQRVHDPRAMSLISVDEVLARLELALHRD